MTNRRKTITVFVIAVVGILLTLMYAARTERTWDAYKVEHECVLTGKDRYVVVYGGRAPQTVHQFEWDCHDGKEHWHR